MSDVLIKAEHLSKSFDRKPVLNDLSFTVQSGDVIGVLGKNGAGKTTLLELILGFTPATSGNVQVFGHDSFRLPGAAKARIGFVPQADELLAQLKVRDQLKVIASFYPRWDDALIARLSQAWELDLDQRIRELSIGQRQKVSILLSLGHHPDLLLLDEPVASLDPIARRQFLEQIVEIAADPKRAVVFSSHIVSDIERLANKIWIIKNGKLHWQGDLDSLKESIVRLHLRGSTLPRELGIANVVSTRRDGSSATVVVSHWSESAHGDVRSRFGTDVTIETLGLEEIFLELHR